MSTHVPNVLKAAAMAASIAGSHSASAAMPQQMWQGVRRVAVACALDAPAEFAAWREQLCRRVAAEAARGAPYPVVALKSMAEADRLNDVTLAIRAFIAPTGDRQGLLTFTVQPSREDIRGEGGAARRGAPVSLAVDARGGGPLADQKIAAALDQILPWRARGRSRRVQ